MQDQVDSSKDYINRVIDAIVNAIPEFLGALLILIVGYIVAKVVSAVLRKALQAARLNEYLKHGQGGNLIQRAIPDPTSFISKVTYWVLFLFAISVAISALGIPALVDLVHGIYGYLPNVLAAFLIFLVAGAISGAVSSLVVSTMGDTPTGKVVATGAPVVVMGLATFMILNQLKIAPEIVTITYAGLVGTATLAFGLGGREAASRMFMGLYEAGQKNKDIAARDFKTGAARGRRKAQDLKDKV